MKIVHQPRSRRFLKVNKHTPMLSLCCSRNRQNWYLHDYDLILSWMDRLLDIALSGRFFSNGGVILVTLKDWNFYSLSCEACGYKPIYELERLKLKRHKAQQYLGKLAYNYKLISFKYELSACGCPIKFSVLHGFSSLIQLKSCFVRLVYNLGNSF